jgi:hypothetical protein
MTDKLVVVGRYVDELSAQIAAMALEANGVPAQVSADNAGGALPSMAFVYPIRLLVREEDEKLARELLESPVESDDESSG